MKTLLKFLTVFLSLCFVSLCMYAQDSTGTNPSGGTTDGIFEKIIANAMLIIPAILGIYEIVARLVPTIKDISLVNKIVGALQWVLDKLIPNKVADAPKNTVYTKVTTTETK